MIFYLRPCPEVERICSGVRQLEAKGHTGPITAAEAIAAAPQMAKHGEMGRGRNRGDVITSMRGTTGRGYLAARLKRDHPDIVQRVEAGEFKSIRAAAIAQW